MIVVIVVLLLLLLAYGISTYNGLISLRQNVEESWSAIETELKRRYDLIPNLVEVVKGYAGHEKETLENVIAARGMVSKGGNLEDEFKKQDMLTSALGKLMVVSEAYPELKANENFKDLQQQLESTETRISQSRRFYNAVVRDYNTSCLVFPSNIIANIGQFNQKPYFGLENPAEFESVKINFNHSDTDSHTIKLEQNKEHHIND